MFGKKKEEENEDNLNDIYNLTSKIFTEIAGISTNLRFINENIDFLRKKIYHDISEYKILYNVFISKKDQKIVGINKYIIEDCKNINTSYFIDLLGRKRKFDRKQYFNIHFVSKVDPNEFEYDYDNVKIIINKLLSGEMSKDSIELLYEIHFN